MKHGQAIVALLSLLVLAWAPNLIHRLAEAGDGQAGVSLKLVRCIDADTLEGDVVIVAKEGESLPWGLESDTRPIKIVIVAQRIRVHGVDAWELKEERGKKARDAVIYKMSFAKTIKLTPKGKDNFGRLLSVVTIVDNAGKETVLADWLIEHKHGVPYRR